ncbi:MAG: hypothetical protein ACI9OJ_001686 [Myxococcota bacterium]|jgi:hypothetical protein
MSAWTFQRVITVMYQKANTGVLSAMGADGETRIHLQDGKVVGLETEETPEWTLEEFLVSSDTLSVRELRSALKRAEAKGQTLEDYLVASEMVTRDVLGRFIELEIREILFRLFERSGITCRFEKSEAPQANPWISAIPIPFLVKEAAKRGEKWPDLRRKIPHHDIVFDKVDAHIESVLGSDRRIDVTPNERVVYFYVNGKKTAHQVAFAACLGEFDAFSALARLRELELITQLKQHGKGEAQRSGRRFGPAVIKLSAYGVAAAVVAALVILRPLALGSPGELVAPIPMILAAGQDIARGDRYRSAIETFRLREGHYPLEPSELNAAKLLSADDVEHLAHRFVYALGERARTFTLESRLPMWQ